ncbi:MAG: hypothetical protein NTW25_13090 [Candidatus Kapabacteria bacterium]|nr:hypothetical protein [Candidatus Kapabacteria bacterium]
MWFEKAKIQYTLKRVQGDKNKWTEKKLKKRKITAKIEMTFIYIIWKIKRSVKKYQLNLTKNELWKTELENFSKLRQQLGQSTLFRHLDLVLVKWGS